MSSLQTLKLSSTSSFYTLLLIFILLIILFFNICFLLEGMVLFTFEDTSTMIAFRNRKYADIDISRYDDIN